MFKKIDKYLYELAGKATKHWIKKRKFQQHKFDMLIWLKQFLIPLFVVAYIYPAIVHNKINPVTIGIAMFLSFIILGCSYFELQGLKIRKEKYDQIWELRKNPVLYKIHKEVMAEIFEEQFKFRKIIVIMYVVFGLLLAITNPIFLIVHVIRIAEEYIKLVFDFDEPDKKEKREKDSVTDLVRRTWQTLIGNLNPHGT